MALTVDSPVTTLLSTHHIPYNVIAIPLSEDKKPIRSLEVLLSNQGIDPQSVVRSIVFKTNDDQFALLALAGGGRADWNVLRKHLNTRKCRMAEFDEVPEVTGYVVGAVPPIALPEKIKVLLDNSVTTYEEVVIGSGVLGFALSLKSIDLLSLMTSADHGQFISA